MESAGGFVPVEEFVGPLQDRYYVNGAIDLAIDGIQILDVSHWDLINQLWEYFVDGLEIVCRGESFETYFPDQPLKFSIKPIRGNRVLVVRDGPDRVSVAVKRDELLAAFVEGATRFLKSFEPFDRDGLSSRLAPKLDSVRNHIRRWRSGAPQSGA